MKKLPKEQQELALTILIAIIGVFVAITFIITLMRLPQ